MSAGFRVIPGVFASPAVSAHATRRQRIEDAIADMGNGLVIDESGRVVAFHESHLPFVTAGVGNYHAQGGTP